MKRIGIAASKIAKGNLWAYNFYVVFLAFLFSLLIFVIAGSAIVLALVVIGYLVKGVLPTSLKEGWGILIYMSLISLSVVISFITLFAILLNIRLRYGMNGDLDKQEK